MDEAKTAVMAEVIEYFEELRSYAHATFVLLTRHVATLLVIGGTHFLIDRYRLARFVVWAKNGCKGPVTATGYPDDVPAWLAVWLLIIADNTLHILINGAALRWLA